MLLILFCPLTYMAKVGQMYIENIIIINRSPYAAMNEQVTIDTLRLIDNRRDKW